MISKIIQKEKERQEELEKELDSCPKCSYEDCEVCCETRHLMKWHKQSLINLKEYLEELRGPPEDISELTKMIEMYNDN